MKNSAHLYRQTKPVHSRERVDFNALLHESVSELNEMQQRALERSSTLALPRTQRGLNPVALELKRVGLV